MIPSSCMHTQLYDHTANGSKTAKNEGWGQRSLNLENVVTLLLNCGNTKLRLMAFK